MDMAIAATAENLTKIYGSAHAKVVALDEVDLEINQGEFTAIMGPSGSGKSTLMHVMAGLDAPTAGRVLIGDDDIFKLNDDKLTELRRDRIGFVFQSFNLVPTLTARENIVLPLAIAGQKVDAEWLDSLVATVGLGDRLTHRPNQMSGGQQQRVACARALITKPDIVFADEPTGNLDSKSGGEVLKFLRESCDELRQTTVMVTHDAVAASYADRAIFLADGKIVADEYRLTSGELIELMAELYGGGMPDRQTYEAAKPRRAAE